MIGVREGNDCFGVLKYQVVEDLMITFRTYCGNRHTGILYTVNHEIHNVSNSWVFLRVIRESSEYELIKSHEIFPLLTNNTPVLQIHMK